MAGPWLFGGKYEHPDTPKPKGEAIRQKIRPGSFTVAKDARSMCKDSFGAMGACVRPKGHKEHHADVNGYQWRKDVAPTTYAKPAGRPDVDPIDAAGGSQPARLSQPLRHLNQQQFGDIHRVWQGHN